ncbi:alpha-1,4-glucan--maltose-1-phosphate maltosyltransferase [Ohtaekwangia koreensis]|uniref:Alpha-1,4-glucan:maltose-1-phosphate maltosyltransferase n=1 Tax=Ohtaekwangia koreensis TaxID=688867 RepID=A0A1T5KE53_9BACT|nr:alpha-1,4-glucan--maltose-1-phosphate maltosyltransferase [Ohtaekwangia koreensis]SKC61947.1 alpha-1,4-glucan:maltose-1-phosphate maltosyltransferase [Ohtaekwangia koreensis]
MQERKGQSRVMIENVQPQVDGGLYPAKRTVGERVDVTADIFGDGHDHIRAQVWYKKDGDAEWTTVEMLHVMNDSWKGTFHVQQKCSYLYTVVAWIDHFETWYDGFKKKAAAHVDVKVELQEGAIILKKLAKDKNNELLNAATKLEAPYNTAIEYVLSEEFKEIVHHYPLVEFETLYDKVLPITVEHKKANFSSWYELFPRSASLEGKHGTFQDVIKLLPRVAAMGFDILYLPPIHPIGKVNRKGKNNNVHSEPGEPGSPWAIGSDEGGHKSIHQELGTLEDYKRLIREAKHYHIDIALDLAFQCAPDHPYVKENPQWFKQRPDGSIQYAENPPKKYQDIYPFNFETDDWMALWQELKSVITFWVDNGVQIFRVDNPHTKPIPFWQWAIAEVNKLYPDIIFLSEAFTRPRVMASLGKIGFTQSYTYFTWRTSKAEIIEYMNELVNGPSRNYFRPNFWPNTPDILPWHLQHQGENIFIIRLALAATLSSNYGIYGPAYEFYDNIPMEGKEEYYNSEKYEVKQYDWKRTNRMTDIITIINKARKNHAALQSTWNIHFCFIENPNLLAFVKATDDLSSIVLVVVNLDQHNKQNGYVQLPKSLLKIGDHINVKLYDAMTDDHYTWTQEWNYVEIDPYKMPFHLFKLEVHESYM